MIGGLGPCGRPICCGSFLGDFQPVSIKMAKEQSLSLNPTKISGVCGRLMCCLKFEDENYIQTRKRMPKMGKDVETPDGFGTVVDLNILKETVSVRVHQDDSNEIKVYPVNDVVWFKMDRKPDKNDAAETPQKRANKQNKRSAAKVVVEEDVEDNAEIEVLANDDEEVGEEEYFDPDEETYEQEPLSHELNQENAANDDWQAEVAQALRNTNGNK